MQGGALGFGAVDKTVRAISDSIVRRNFAASALVRKLRTIVGSPCGESAMCSRRRAW